MCFWKTQYFCNKQTVKFPHNGVICYRFFFVLQTTIFGIN